MDIEQKVDKILFYMESDSKTKRVGVVEQVSLNTKDIRIFKTKNAVLVGKVTIAATIFSVLGTIILKLFGFFK